ncbi:hypothetical protein C8Q73DRAFT_367302 [Cubamyces lactineus]|nr:hypothetical protein C8Q73DRAFT_367302 [Cubamyces lactineus]
MMDVQSIAMGIGRAVGVGVSIDVPGVGTADVDAVEGESTPATGEHVSTTLSHTTARLRLSHGLCRDVSRRPSHDASVHARSTGDTGDCDDDSADETRCQSWAERAAWQNSVHIIAFVARSRSETAMDGGYGVPARRRSVLEPRGRWPQRAARPRTRIFGPRRARAQRTKSKAGGTGRSDERRSQGGVSMQVIGDGTKVAAMAIHGWSWHGVGWGRSSSGLRRERTKGDAGRR